MIMIGNRKERIRRSISHSVTSLIEKSPAPGTDENPRPLDHQACALLLCFNHSLTSSHLIILSNVWFFERERNDLSRCSTLATSFVLTSRYLSFFRPFIKSIFLSDPILSRKKHFLFFLTVLLFLIIQHHRN